MLATVSEKKALLDTVIASLVAGIGVTAVFAILVFGVTRSAEMARDERPAAATAAGTLAVVSFLIVAGAIVLGIVVMVQK